MACGSCGGSKSLRKPNNNQGSNQKAVTTEVKVYNSTAQNVSLQRAQNITVKRTKV